ncbi:MAG: ABC transporter ATP-binding protein [Oscillospiraceae bacterium]|nr:ABC transporter ATP-binding protein [Oscillospiraceae bacterium]
MEIVLKNVSKRFDGKAAVDDVILSIKSGEKICLLGPSGSGKTTTIRLLIGAISADSGEITIGDVKVPNFTLLSKIGFMPQNDALYDDLSGEDNLRFFAESYGMKKNEIEERINECVALVDLGEHRKKRVGNYSGGMKKRLSLAVALIHQPDVLLLDEPTVGIDPVLRREIWNELHSLSKQGKTILVSTHVLDEVAECDKAALLYNGRLIEFDKTKKLMTKTGGKIEELFFAADTKGGESK